MMAMATTTYEMETMIRGYHVCGMPRLERSSTALEKREIFVIHTLSL